MPLTSKIDKDSWSISYKPSLRNVRTHFLESLKMSRPLRHLAESLSFSSGACALGHIEPCTYALIGLDYFVRTAWHTIPWASSARDLSLRKSALRQLSNFMLMECLVLDERSGWPTSNAIFKIILSEDITIYQNIGKYLDWNTDIYWP